MESLIALAITPVDIVVGVDIGKVHDFTTIAVNERRLVAVPDMRTGRDRYVCRHEIRHIERVALGTDYMDVGNRIVDVCHGAKAKGKERAWAEMMEIYGRRFDVEVPVEFRLFMDVTGIGLAVADHVRSLGVHINPVQFVASEHRRVHADGRVVWGKEHLAARVNQVLITGQLKFPRSHPLKQALLDELTGFEIRATGAGRAKFEAKPGEKDDLVIAVALAVQEDLESSEIPPDFLDFVRAQL